MKCVLCRLSHPRLTGGMTHHRSCCHFCIERLLQNQPTCGIDTLRTTQGQTPIVSPFLHQDLPQILLHNFKYRRHLLQGKVLCHWLIRSIAHTYATRAMPEYIVHIPQTSARWLSRGFSPTDRLAHWLGDALGIPVIPLLARVGSPLQQAGLSRSRRIQNVRASFEVQQSRCRQNAPDISNLSHIAIVDDVITTGATVTEAINTCASTLQAQGKRLIVDAWCLTRAD